MILFGANAGSLLVVDDPQSSDAILVLAGETNYRPTRALQLLHQGYAGRILLDVPANAQVFGTGEIELAKRYVNGLPEAAAISICPIEGLSTKAEAFDIKKCLEHESAANILVVTSDFHTRRALSILRHEIPFKAFSVAAVHDPTQFGLRWWTHRQWAKTCVDEWLRLLWWSVVERWV
ncbi:MAG: YdcF family protein [Candidatus Sulfotelmatobacter sp.]